MVLEGFWPFKWDSSERAFKFKVKMSSARKFSDLAQEERKYYEWPKIPLLPTDYKWSTEEAELARAIKAYKEEQEKALAKEQRPVFSIPDIKKNNSK